MEAVDNVPTINIIICGMTISEHVQNSTMLKTTRDKKPTISIIIGTVIAMVDMSKSLLMCALVFSLNFT